MSMQGTSENVLATYAFSLEVDGLTQQFFTSVDGLSITVEILDTWGSDAAGMKIFEQKIPGPISYGDISVQANLTTNSYIRDWRKEVVTGKFSTYRRNGSIVLYNGAYEEQARWNFLNGWPSSYSLGDLTASNSSVSSESITIVHEGLERV